MQILRAKNIVKQNLIIGTVSHDKCPKTLHFGLFWHGLFRPPENLFCPVFTRLGGLFCVVDFDVGIRSASITGNAAKLAITLSNANNAPLGGIAMNVTEAEETIGLEWNALWDAMRNAPSLWVKTTEDMFYEMLGAVPPQDMFGRAFLVGEASDTTASGDDVFACFVAHTNGTYEARYMTQLEFDAWKAIRQEGTVTK